MHILANPHRGRGLPAEHLAGAPMPSVDASRPRALLRRCPAGAPTPLRDAPSLARAAGVASVAVKDERERMGLGSFKALGAAYVIACDAEEAGGGEAPLRGRTYVAASAGNHGLSVAAGAAIFGARAMIYIAESVPESFAARLVAKGAEVVREGRDYAQSMAAARRRADKEGWTLLSDSSWPGYFDLPHRLMEGYLTMAAELVEACPEPPSHLFLHAGVGGMAGAVAAYLRAAWGAGPVIAVVEPAFAPALIESIRAGRPVVTEGPDSSMGRLDCKEPSLIALAGLARDADHFVTITEAEAAAALPLLAAAGLETTPSGGAGLAALLAAGRPAADTLGLSPDARVLAVLSEVPE